MKQLWQPSKIKRVRKIGFRARMATRGGRQVLGGIADAFEFLEPELRVLLFIFRGL